MQALDLTLSSPAENLALDEALLLEAEAGHGNALLRFWMSDTPFVVVGLGIRVSREVHTTTCAVREIPILRRCTGGGTVVQGPGCLNYALVLKIPASGPLASIPGTNQFIMSRQAHAIAKLTGQDVRVEGHTDLAIARVKFSGNAQRRLRRHLLFHGTFLLQFDLAMISDLLRSPSRQPEYRSNRAHEGFLMNLGTDADDVRAALCDEWRAIVGVSKIPSERVSSLVQAKYGKAEWTFRWE